MNLRETRVTESRPAAIRAPDGRTIRTLRVRREIKDVPVSARSEYDSVGQVRLDFSRNKVPSDDTARLAIDDDQIEHFRPWKHCYFAGSNLTEKRLIGPEQQLLARLAACVKRPRYLSASKRAIGEQAT